METNLIFVCTKEKSSVFFFVFHSDTNNFLENMTMGN